MEKNEYIRAIKKLGACEEAVKDAHNFKTSKELWAACERGDWMLWLIGRTIQRSDETALRKLTLVKARCAKLVIHLMKDSQGFILPVAQFLSVADSCAPAGLLKGK
jgi:hypothetical protein